MKVVVYAICKNEAKFVDRWMDSMSEADQVVVLDTGSSDGTAEKLKSRGLLCVWKSSRRGGLTQPGTMRLTLCRRMRTSASAQISTRY